MKTSLIVAGLLLAGSSLMATDGYYVGTNYSSMKYKTGITNLTGTAKLDDKDNAYKFFVGYEITKNLGIEAHFADFGEASLSGNSGDRFTYGGTVYQFTANNANVKLGFESIGIGAVIKQEVNKYMLPYLKLGVHSGDMKLSASSTNGSTTATKSSTELFYAAGINFPINEKLSVLAEYNIYKFEYGDIKGGSIGLQYKF